MSAGNSVFVNEYFKKNDWVELYNTTEEDIDLEGMYLSDNLQKPMKWQITAGGSEASTVVPAGGTRIIWCDGMQSIDQLHAPFKLENADSALVLLTSADQSWADTLIYCAHEGGESVGRFPDGGSELYRMYRPSIDGPNRMNLYTTIWQEPQTPSSIGQPVMAQSQGGMSLRCSQGVLFVKSEEEPNVRLSIYTTDGRLAMQTEVQTEGGHAQVQISVLARGTYVARLIDPSGQQCAVKFVR